MLHRIDSWLEFHLYRLTVRPKPLLIFILGIIIAFLFGFTYIKVIEALFQVIFIGNIIENNVNIVENIFYVIFFGIIITATCLAMSHHSKFQY